MYTPATTSDSDSDVMSISGKETVVNLEGKASKGAKHPGPVGAGLGLMRSGAMMGAVKENLGVNYGSSSDELAVPLERTYNSPLDKVIKDLNYLYKKILKIYSKIFVGTI